MWGLGKKVNREAREKFWQWFVANEDRLFHFERNQEKVFAALSNQLKMVDPDLCFEFGPADGSREFVISAGGITKAFQAVISLTDAAPKLPRWKFTAFRPRRIILNSIRYKEKSIGPDDISCTLLLSPTEQKVGLRLFINGYREDDVDFKVIGYLMLDETLGEFDVETRLGGIEMLAPEVKTVGHRIPLSDLASHFDRLVAEIDGRTLKPS
jgi:hypothetical protein